MLKFIVLTLSALALGIIALPDSSQAAGVCIGKVNCGGPAPYYKPTRHCYYLPTVANGRVTGVALVCNK